MTAKTQFSADDLRVLLAGYNLGEYVAHRSFEEGTDQTNLLLETDRGKYAFRYYETRLLEYALFEINILKYLAEHAFPCPAPIANKTGEFVGMYNNKPFALFEFLEGIHSNEPDVYKQIARVYGKLHKITSEYVPEYSEVRDSYDQISILHDATVNAQKLNSAEAEIRLGWVKSEIAKLQTVKDLPKGVVHGDSRPENFLHQDGKLTGVLDFDQSSYTYLLYELTGMISRWAWPEGGALDFEIAKDIINEYEKHRKLVDVEKELLYDMLKMLWLVVIGWFIYNDEEYESSKVNIEYLNTLGREEFYKRLFL